jgi:MFS family permease
VELVVVLGLLVAVAAAARSTWSPCGQSMLSQITPLSERARNQHFGVTAAWFVVGSVAGGATLGVGSALGAAVASAAGLSDHGALGVLAALAVACAAIDSGVLGVRPPFFHRQVNEDWLPRYRGWLYGVGFGWQVGVGFATYIMTAAVFLTAAVGVLSASPPTAFAIAVGFGLSRGLTVFFTARVHTPLQLQAFHRRFDAWSEPIRLGVIATQLVVALWAGIATWGVVGAVVIGGLGALVAIAALRSLPRRARAHDTSARAHA